MPSNAEARINSTTNRLDAMLARYARQDAEREAREAAERDREAAEQARRHRERKRQYQVAYSDSFAALGSEPPMPLDDETSLEYRCRLYDRLRRKLSPDHELANVRERCAGHLSAEGFPLWQPSKGRSPNQPPSPMPRRSAAGPCAERRKSAPVGQNGFG